MDEPLSSMEEHPAMEGVPLAAEVHVDRDTLNKVEFDLELLQEPKVEPAPPHVLTVRTLDQGSYNEVEYEVRHPGCIGYMTHTSEVETGDDHTWERKHFDCWFSNEVENVGFMQAIGVEIFKGGQHVLEHLPTGTYLLTPWVNHYPATPNGPEEWDTGTTVERVCPSCHHEPHDGECEAVTGYDHMNGDHECGCPGEEES